MQQIYLIFLVGCSHFHILTHFCYILGVKKLNYLSNYALDVLISERLIQN